MGRETIIMKTVYFGHARSFDYEKEWYEPIRNLVLESETEVLLPHDAEGESRSTKELFEKGCDLFVAEVSYPSTGLGMELGYADVFHVPIVCFFKQGVRISNSLKRVTENFIEYSDTSDLQKKLQKIMSSL